MKRPSENSEDRVMHGIAVALLSEDGERLKTLQDRLRATGLAREVFSHIGFPVSATDTIIRKLQESRADVVIIDVPSQDAQRAIRAIELIRATTQIAIFANGGITQPGNIVASMRNGASEYVDRSAGYEALLEALTRFTSSRTRELKAARKARAFTFLNAKGGAGCTTAAVNTALALQKSHGDVALVDFAPIVRRDRRSAARIVVSLLHWEVRAFRGWRIMAPATKVQKGQIQQESPLKNQDAQP